MVDLALDLGADEGAVVLAEQDDIANSQIQLQGRVENGRVIPEYLSSTAVTSQGRLKGPDGNRPMVVLNACQAGASATG